MISSPHSVLPLGVHLSFLTKALSIYVPLVSRTVLLDLALPDTWDYKAPSTAPDFFPQLCNGEWSEKFLRRKILGDFHGVRTRDPWISPWNDRNKPAALPTAPRGLGLTTTTTYTSGSLKGPLHLNLYNKFFLPSNVVFFMCLVVIHWIKANNKSLLSAQKRAPKYTINLGFGSQITTVELLQ